MKIGVVTFWTSKDNYGQLLQVFALQRFLKNMGHSPFLIRFPVTNQYNPQFKLSKIGRYIWRVPLKLGAYISAYRNKKKEKKTADIFQYKSRDFDGFRSKYIIMSESTYDYKSIVKAPPMADAYICGSDQIWWGDELFCLSFAPKGAKRIAYAPSTGGLNLFQLDNVKSLRQTLAKLDFIGMREESAAQQMRDNGFPDAVQVADPTLLLTATDYEAFLDDVKEHIASDAFIYMLGNTISCNMSDVIDYVHCKELSYTYVASQGRQDDYPKSGLTIPEWVDTLRHSKVVITNSFHCVVFALIFHRPFIFVPLADEFERMNDRVYDLLEKTGLMSQCYRGDFNKVPLNISFAKFDLYKNSAVKFSTNMFEIQLS